MSPGGIAGRGPSQSMANSNGFITVIVDCIWTASEAYGVNTLEVVPLAREALACEALSVECRRLYPDFFALFTVSVGHIEIVAKVHKHPAKHEADVHRDEEDSFVEGGSLFSSVSFFGTFLTLSHEFLKLSQFPKTFSNILFSCSLVLPPPFVMISFFTCLKWKLVGFPCLSV